MTTATAAQILQAMKNHHRPPQTIGARIKAALKHASTSPLRQMLELERQRRTQKKREGIR